MGELFQTILLLFIAAEVTQRKELKIVFLIGAIILAVVSILEILL